MTQGGTERRRAARATAEFPIQLTDLGGARAANLRDISTNGLCCLYPEAIREMTKVRIDLQLPGLTASMPVEGVVVRCDKLRGRTPAAYEIGIYFTDVPAAVRAALGDFVAANLPTT